MWMQDLTYSRVYLTGDVKETEVITQSNRERERKIAKE